jgi:ABC-type lipoprotein release transport system permease subunit
MSAAQRRELEEIRDSVGVDDVSREDAEAALFGGGATEEEETTPAEDVEVPDQLGSAREFNEEFDPEEMRRGLALNAAVILDDPEAAETVVARIDALPGLQASEWEEAAGIVGRFVSVMTGVLWIVLLVILMVASLILNNTTVMATMERIPEFGTLRAIGGGRPTIFALVLLEAGILSVIAAAVGSLAAVGVLLWLAQAGIPATSGTVVFLFGGDRLYPVPDVYSVSVAFGLVFAVTLGSTLYPAWIATRVPPVVAMEEN